MKTYVACVEFTGKYSIEVNFPDFKNLTFFFPEIKDLFTTGHKWLEDHVKQVKRLNLLPEEPMTLQKVAEEYKDKKYVFVLIEVKDT